MNNEKETITFAKPTDQDVEIRRVLGAVYQALTEKGYTVLSAEAEKVPANYTQLTDEDSIKKMQLLLDHLEENDDVQNVYHNWEMPDDAE
jgi:transcriptional/translational regulatory protein YebC/TACO1